MLYFNELTFSQKNTLEHFNCKWKRWYKLKQSTFKYNLLLPLDNIFQKQFNMTRPNNFINRNAGFSYPLAYYPWSYLPSGPFNMGNNMPYSPFQNHLPFLNMQAYKSPYHNGTMPALPFQANDNSIRAHLSAINALADDRKKSRSNKF